MGCPKAFSLSGGMGAALLSKPELISDVSLIVYRCFGCDRNRILDWALRPTSGLNMKLVGNADVGSLLRGELLGEEMGERRK